jgi:hypothetical protein
VLDGRSPLVPYSERVDRAVQRLRKLTRSPSLTLGVPRGMIQCARTWIHSLRDDPDEEPFAMYFVARCDESNVAWCMEHHLMDVEQVADHLVIPMEAVRRAINDCVRATRPKKR